MFNNISALKNQPASQFSAGWGLSDSSGQPFKWVFPEVTIQPQGYLLVWASGKNRAKIDSLLHTNFSISASGEELLLTNSAETLIDAVAPIAVTRDVSYERTADGAGTWGFFEASTPGTSNNSSTWYSEILSEIEVSHQGGFCTAPFNLTISHSDPNVKVIDNNIGPKLVDKIPVQPWVMPDNISPYSNSQKQHTQTDKSQFSYRHILPSKIFILAGYTPLPADRFRRI